MHFEPVLQAAGATIRKQIDNMMILEINQNGAVGDIATKRPIVYSKVGGCGMCCQRGFANEPQKGIRTTCDPQCTGDARSLFASKSKTKACE